MPVFGLDPMVSQLKSLDYNNPVTINLLKYMQTVQSVGLFVLPPFVIALLFEGSISKYLQLNGNFKKSLILISIILVIVANPVINFMGALNADMSLPDWLSGIEAQMKAMEENAALLLEKFMDVKTTGGLLFNLVMIAVIPALGEEFLFRGVIQKIFSNWTKSVHWGIWISAILFSALHMQFYGFIPRMLLGAIFGYMLVWSGSMWVPVLAHFINNALGVIGLFLINRGAIDPKIEDIGSSSEQLPIAIASLGLFIFLGAMFYKNRTQHLEQITQKAESDQV